MKELPRFVHSLVRQPENPLKRPGSIVIGIQALPLQRD
jgi:hypothetical protein